jgi:uncharacterized protein YndB with AHSA1/START domain
MPKPFEIRKEVELEATPEQVWDAIATGPGLSAWLMPMPMDADSDMVEAWEPGRRLAIRTPEADDGATQAFEYLIEARGQGSTVLRFVHSGFGGDDWSDEYEAMTSGGWDMYLHTLSQYLAHYAGRPAVYVEAEGPPASAKADAWSRLAPALGLPGPVHVEVIGDAEVDYTAPTFIGLRTPDALVRFHGRSSIGLPVAVSHHAYTSIDAPATTKAWEAWLERVFS